MAVHDELLARLKTVDGTAAVFDIETLPQAYTSGSAPYLLLQDISTVPDVPIDDSVIGTDGNWQVSVRGRNLRNVRTVAQAVADSLHGFSSDSIKHVARESWLGTLSEGGGTQPREFHAPLEFTVKT